MTKMNDSDIEAMQALDFEDEDDDVNDDELDNENKPVAFLNIPCQNGFAGKTYPMFQGDNVIGRSEECKICIPFKSLSREHACIEVRGADHFIYDKGSRNRTRRNKHFLATFVRYELKNNDHLLFGDVEADYVLNTQTVDDDGDETNSEFNFDCTPYQKELANQGIGDVKALENHAEDTYQEEDYQSDASSDILKPTQVTATDSLKSLTKKQSVDNVPNSPSLRQTTLEGNKAKVMFTGLIDEQGEKVVKELGGEMVSSVLDCTHLVTDQVRRTVKFLCCLSKGIPIVSPQWLVCSKTSGLFTDPASFIIQDHVSEKKYKFNLRRSLDKANKKCLLEGYRIHVTNSVKPEPAQMKDILQSAGALYLLTIPKSNAPNTLIISCPEDKELCETSVKAGIPVLNTEFILTGLLRQEININALFSDGNGNKKKFHVPDSTDTKHRKR